jgi:hypothetical protein
MPEPKAHRAEFVALSQVAQNRIQYIVRCWQAGNLSAEGAMHKIGRTMAIEQADMILTSIRELRHHA